MNEIDALLERQGHELARLAQILDSEFDVLKQRQHDALLAIAQQKAASLQCLSNNDAQLSKLVDHLSDEHKEFIAQLKQQLNTLKAQNKKNGKLLALTAASHHRLRSLMLPAEKVAGTTYTKQGQKHHAGHGSCHFAV